MHYPSFAEHQWYYNIIPGEEDVDGTPDKDRSKYFKTVDQLPPITWSEKEQASQAVYKCLETRPRPPRIPPEELKRFYQYCVKDVLLDRTLVVHVPEIQVLTAEFVRQLQRDVLASRPLWRIWIVGEEEGPALLIYPDTVYVGGQGLHQEWTRALPTLVAQIVEIRNTRDGPEKRQLEYLQARIPGQIGNLRDPPIRFLAAFDNFCGNHSRTTVWFLGRNDTHSWSHFCIRAPEHAATADDYEVTSAGKIRLRGDPVHAEFVLIAWVLPAAFRGKLAIQKEKPINEITRQPLIAGRWEFDFDPKSIIKDADLKGAAKIGAGGKGAP